MCSRLIHTKTILTLVKKASHQQTKFRKYQKEQTQQQQQAGEQVRHKKIPQNHNSDCIPNKQ